LLRQRLTVFRESIRTTPASRSSWRNRRFIAGDSTQRRPFRRIEYTGERISRRETKRRADASEMIYLFTLDAYWTLDGSVGGSGAEYINHSCDPNLVTRIVKGHIIYMSQRDIKAGEELTVDYRFDKKVERVECKCGTVKCRGTINLTE
jgi:SET domain-containing protein